MNQLVDNNLDKAKPNFGLWLAAALGISGLVTMSLSVPFVLPALRKHCLPYVPATDTQLDNLRKAFATHCKPDGLFLDVGSGDGRICRLAANLGLFNQVHGIELNSVLVNFCRLHSLFTGQMVKLKYVRGDLWKYPMNRYDYICIFGVESMMKPFARYLIDQNNRNQIIFACRFPIEDLNQVDAVGSGIDTVWIYKLDTSDDCEKIDRTSQTCH